MTKSYDDLLKELSDSEKALNNAYAQVTSMSVLIGVLLEHRTTGEYSVMREELENNYKAFDVIVEAEQDYITLSLSPKEK